LYICTTFVYSHPLLEFTLGRVQTPTLSLIVKREEEIINFVPKQYYQVVGTFDSSNGSYKGTWITQDGKTNQFSKEEEAKTVASKVQGQQGLVDKLEKKLVKEKAPLLYDLTLLQRVANNKYGLTASQTLEIAQSLYEMKVLSYPRTSSQHLSTNLAQEIKANLKACNIAPYNQFVGQILGSSIKLTTRHVDNKKITDHHAIIPTTKSVDINTLDDKQRKVYDLVVRRFLAMFYPDAEIEQTMIVTKVDGEHFLTRGKVILKPGWQVVEQTSSSKEATEEKTDADAVSEQEEANLPLLKEKQAVKTIKAEVLSKWTKPPSHYTESGLLFAMECAGREIDNEKLRQAMKDCGLGTPATRASIIETLLKQDYIVRDKKSLKPTVKGMSLIKLLPCEVLKSAELTASWEQKLNAIEKGDYSSITFLSEIKVMIEQIVKEIAQSDIANKLETIYRQSAQSCPKCLIENRNGVIVKRKSEKGNILVCSLGKSACGYLSSVPRNSKELKALFSNKCPSCKGSVKLYIPKEKGKSPALFCIKDKQECGGALWFNDKGALVVPKTDNSNGKAKAEMGPPCNKCGKPTVKKGPFKSKKGKTSYFFGCVDYKKGCDAEANWIN